MIKIPIDLPPIQLPPMKGSIFEDQGVELLEEPKPVPGTNKLRCLANANGALCIVELALNFSRDINENI